MTRGVVFVAHNNETVNYYEMATYAAQHVRHHLDLPVTVITDESSLNKSKTIFNSTILVDSNKNNRRNKNTWINKNRFRVYDLSPYDETLVLDTDYLVNSNNLLRLFGQKNDFGIHNSVYWLMENQTTEYLGTSGIPTCWATVIYFRKTNRVEQIFDMMEMIQNNYEHYAQIYGFMPNIYRNDYAITIALKTVNGHLSNQEDFIPWHLNHIDKRIKVTRDGESYKLTQNIDNKNWYLKIKNIDFHMISKINYLELHR